MRNKDNKLYAFCVFVYRIFGEFGIDALKTRRAFLGLIPFFRDALLFSKDRSRGRLSFPRGVPFPCLSDRFQQSGTAGGVYFHQDLWVAQKIFQANPERHLDVGSRVDGFVTHVASFREIEVVDIRPLTASAKNIRFRQADVMAGLDDRFVECCDSLSCLHALEHFGLGRYGDPICRDGFMLGWDNLYRILKKCGTLYFSVPMGRARVEFNAHRVFSLQHLLHLVDNRYDILSFSYVDDAGAFFENINIQEGVKGDFGCHFGCAILELRKR